MTGTGRSALPPVEVGVRCAGQRHVLSWTAGTLTALDHPDPVRERALVALGGRPYRCLELLEDWERHIDDLDVLVLASRGSTDEVRVNPAEPDEADGHAALQGGQAVPTVAYLGSYRRRPSFGWHAGHPHRHVHPEASSDRGIETLLTLDRRLADRLVLSVVTTWVQRIADDDPRVPAARPALRAALYGRTVRTVRSWLGEPSRAVEVQMLAPGEPPGIAVDESGVLVVGLDFGWLAEVWLPGAAVVLGRLVLGAVHESATAWTLHTIGHDLNDMRTMRVAW